MTDRALRIRQRVLGGGSHAQLDPDVVHHPAVEVGISVSGAKSTTVLDESGIQLFASRPDDPRARRTIDVVRAVACVTLLAIAAVLSVIGADLDERIGNVLTSAPGFLRVIWVAGYWGAVLWAVVLVVITMARGRWSLVGEIAVAVLLGAALATIVAEIASKSAGDLYRQLGDIDGPAVFPPLILVATSAVLATAAPRLTLPFRRFGRALIAAQLVGALMLGVALTSGAVASIATGLLAGSVLHVVFGSPGGLPTLGRVRAALSDLGIELEDLHPIAIASAGVAELTGRDEQGVVQVRVYGRDAWDGEFVADVWRRVWYRGNTRRFRFSRAEYVEHEGFMTFLAQHAGATVPDVVTAGLADNGDALIALRPIGDSLAAAGTSLSAEQIASLWHQLDLLHAARIAHQRIDLDRVGPTGDDQAAFIDLSSASVQWEAEDILKDHAQLIALTLVAANEGAAGSAARDALGDEAFGAVLPYLQDAAMPPLTRSALHRGHVALDDVRKRWAEQLDASEPELVKLRRVTPRSFLNLALFAFAGYTLIGMLGDIDFGTFFRALRDANWWWLGAALVVGQTPRVANAFSAIGSLEQPLPFGPTTQLQFASCYVNLAVPSSAGRVAITTRFYQRFGVAPATALAAGVIDSVSELLIQLALFLSIFFISDVDLGLSVSQDQLSGVATTALIVIGVLVVVIAVGLLVPKLRARVFEIAHQVRDALRVLRTPTKLVELFGGNLLSQVLFAVTLSMCVRAFGMYVPLSKLILINSVVTLFAGLLPVPGGVGVSEAGLSLGLTRVGIPSSLAFAIALSYRFVVFYLPPIWGFFSLKWLTRRHYL
jgi:uncharacterized membrane protein YbhN (UPF0104 family)